MSRERVALVTGVAGQDGSYLAERLLDDGYAVHGTVRGTEDRRFVPRGVVVHELDLADRPAVARVVDEVAPDEVANLAGMTSVAASWADPEGAVAVTGAAVVGVLEACLRLQERRGKPVRVLQASSAEMFGEPTTCPQDEATALAPVSPYGAAKALGHLATGVYRARGLFATSVILYNHESPRRPQTFVTRKIAAAAARISREGGTLHLGNLDARRDWGWAPDYVDAMVRALRHDRPDVFVVATGVGHSVRDLVAAAFAHAGVGPWQDHVVVDPDLFRPTDPSELRGDAAKAARELGWRPTTTFDELVGRLVDAELESTS